MPPRNCSVAPDGGGPRHRGLSRGIDAAEKELAIERFRDQARLLLCTEAGSEGRNLQFAHAVCNFDLPWNPMKIEQRKAG